MRRIVAPATPQKMILVRFSLGRPATAMPMMMALSPDITRSISTTCSKAPNWSAPKWRPSASIGRSGLFGVARVAAREVQADDEHQAGAERGADQLGVRDGAIQPGRDGARLDHLDQLAGGVDLVVPAVARH